MHSYTVEKISIVRPHLLCGDQLSIPSDFSYDTLHQSVDRILIHVPVSPPPIEVLLVCFHGLHSSHIFSKELPELCMITFIKDRTAAFSRAGIPHFGLLLFGQTPICPQHWKIRGRQEAKPTGLFLFFFRFRTLCCCGRIIQTIELIWTIENLCLLCLKWNVLMFGYLQRSATP